MNALLSILSNIWNLSQEMAPYLLFGFLAAGSLSQIISRTFITKHLGQQTKYDAIKAALFGVPMPICSCGVLPLAASLRRQGASHSATASFLASTPQTGIDSLLVTYALLGWAFALFRALAAFLSGILCGWSVEPITPPTIEQETAHPSATSQSTQQRTIQALKHGFITLPRDIAHPLIIGLILSGILAQFIPQNSLDSQLHNPLLSMLFMIIIGLPLYICSSASVPLAYTFIQAGITPGAALVFLILGPATNMATLTTLGQLIGKKAAAIFLIVLTACALLAGILMNAVTPQLGILEDVCDNHATTSLFHTISAILLYLILFNGIRLKK
ncbi:MAG: hypothetical protein CBE26_03180 [Kiritimatiellaceae bacterium TMED266]|nr:MAG: hypothetical protein CBE26_03180 [Kiritimatiellaceae bacterium TMED266]